jgi:radical SAM superfamily enzyme
VKLHNLHVLKQTPLEEMYHKGEFTPIDQITYTRRVQLFLQHLSPHIALHRLAAYSSRWDELVAPEWTKNKMGTHQHIIDHLRAEAAYQSQLFTPSNDHESDLKNLLFKKSRPIL